MKTHFAAFVSTALAAGSLLAGNGIDVVAVYYPHWHQYPKGIEWFGPGWKEAEWAFVKSNPPRYPGHRTPLKPLPGYLSGSDPKDVETEIALASNAGIDVFLYDYYYYNGETTQEEAIEQGFLKAANRDRMKFALMWCYHDRVDRWRTGGLPGEKVRTLMKLQRTPEEFLGLIDLSIARYFNQPEYWRKDGKLFFAIYDAPAFVRSLGEEKARKALSDARAKVRAAGLGEVHFNGLLFSRDRQALAKSVGFDSVMHYNVGPTNDGTFLSSYESLAENSRRLWEKNGGGELPYYPVVTTGWDRSGRCKTDDRPPWKHKGYPYDPIVTNATPDSFRALLADAKAYTERNFPKGGGVVYLNAWNEYTENPGLVPTVRELDLYLRAVANVFGRHPADKLVCCDMKHWWRKDASNGRAFEIEAPTLENVKYGPHYRQGMDVWLAKDAKGPVPCVVHIHGGAWCDGNRVGSSTTQDLAFCRKHGFAYATITYRMVSDAADAGIFPPVKAPVDDAIAAVRFIRAHAKEWNVDPTRIGLTGGSAGACSSLIASLTDDNALGIRAIRVSSPQTTLDPKEMLEWIPNANYGSHAFGLPYGNMKVWMENRERLLKEIETYSPAALARRVTPAKAPTILYACGAQPKPGELTKDPTHAPQFCSRFEELCTARGITCRSGDTEAFAAALR